jgi:hypothetical protein
MKTLLTLLGLLLIVSVAYAGDDNAAPVPVVVQDACTLPFTSYLWDFNVSNQGFTPVSCDASGGAQVWAWGLESTIPGSPGNVWATVLNGNYPNNSGAGLLSPAFLVTPSSYLLEVNHYVRVETNFDGCNVSVNGSVILPTNGYPATISTSTSYYAYCVDLEPGWTGNGSTGPSQNWVAQCFNLSAFMGQMIQVEFDFGSDSSVAYPGWYLAYVAVGGDPPVSVESTEWGRIKTMYR